MRLKSNKKIKSVKIGAILLSLAIFLGITLAYAATNYDVVTSSYSVINEWLVCKRVTNNLQKNLFIPTRTQNEWSRFLSNTPTGIIISSCTSAAPAGLSASAGNSQITLSWSAPSSNGGDAISNYKVYRGTSSGSETLLITIGNVLSYINLGLSNGQTYYYKVSAVNSGGESDLSNEASATPCSSSAIVSYGSWSVCSASCGGGTQTRTNVNQCGQNVAETQSCNTQSCCDSNIISSCGSWGSCSSTCGSGTQARTCTNQCGGSVQQTQSCYDNSGSSAISSCGSWSSCSTKCGSGTQTRTCTNQCGGSTTQSQGCTDTSDVGKVSDSCTGWGSCSVSSCGTGVQYNACSYVCGGGGYVYTRSCTGINGYPGQSCSGCSGQYQWCSTGECVKDSGCNCNLHNCWGNANSGAQSNCYYYQCLWPNQNVFCDTSQQPSLCSQGGYGYYERHSSP